MKTRQPTYITAAIKINRTRNENTKLTSLVQYSLVQYTRVGRLGSVVEPRSADPRSEGPRPDGPSPTGRMLLDTSVYLVARLLLVGVLSVVIIFGAQMLGITEFPVVISVLFAIVIALPLGIWLFAPLRRRATASIAAVDERRRQDRAQLQARLRGEGAAEK